jgi:two-component system, OmpR family, sensor histidine kinase KdpD
MIAHRPDPDALLSLIQKEDARQHRGKLKIFFGMVAGVGKTYAMLEAGRQRRSEGVDVVVGYVETHGRAETEALLRDLEIMPRRKVEYRGTVLEDMDLDALLARKPQVALVDELAHTNAPGSRHRKRYQDVIELLEAGIDVYTTINVQHFESRADAVAQITGVLVHEKVPDSILDLADEIELIDLSPEELRKRLAEGKVYTAERADVAARSFFRTGNLTALREMALRLTAEHVDHKLQDYMQVKHIVGPWKSGERLMVAVSPSPFSEQAVRWTRRMAYNLEAPWLAVFVETSRAPTPAQQEQLARNLDLVRSLGGEVVTTSSNNVADAIERMARLRNVTQIVVGKPQAVRWWKVLRGGTLVDKLIRDSHNIDIYVVAGEGEAQAPPPHPALPSVPVYSSWKRYALALLIVAALTATLALVFEMFPGFGYQAVGLLELFAVLLIAVYLGRGPALLAATASAFSWNYLFIDPRLTLAISEVPDVILFLLYFVIALLAGNLTARLRQQERLASANAERTAALYALAHDTAMAVNMDEVLATGVSQIGRVFDAEVAILLPKGEHLERGPHMASTFGVDDKDFAVAAWVFENRKRAGRNTSTLSQASAQFLPLQTPGRIVGVIGIHMRQLGQLSFDQEQLLETFVNQIALVIERELLDEAAEQSLMHHESERLYAALLNSISHELRTPIASITGAAGWLAAHVDGDRRMRAELVRSIQGAASRLNRLVANLLDMSRLDAGRVKLKLDWCDVGEVIGVAAQRVEDCLLHRPLSIDVPPDLPLVKMDFALMEQVLVNLLDNACNYSPANAPIAIEANIQDGWLAISVTDGGKGIPPDDLERVFEKFYRLPGTASGGTGLGLSICRGLVEAHGGTLVATNAPGAGARFTITLPCGDAPPPVKEADL